MIVSFIQIKRDEQERLAKDNNAISTVFHLCITKVIPLNNNFLSELQCQSKY
jgi:hypothetical protein